MLIFIDARKLVTFEALGDTTQMDRVFARSASATTDSTPRAARLSGSRHFR